LRDHRNAVILGQRSAGKVLLSVHARLPHGFELQYPTADYVTSRGVRLEGSPIMPHIVIPGNGRGPQARTAVSAAAEVLVNGL
jgi:C-terminal processing protease CtpA/Prc